MTDEEQFEHARAQRETLRWLLLKALNTAGHVGASESLLLTVVSPAVSGVTPVGIKHELHYLQDRGLITTERDRPAWLARITADGTDVVDYTTACPPGIGRPSNWGAV